LEELLLEGLDSGASKPMTAARKKQIYRQALELKSRWIAPAAFVFQS
jgi:hypothetical protein